MDLVAIFRLETLIIINEQDKSKSSIERLYYGYVSATVTDERDRRGDSDGHESDEVGYIYSANYEHDAILRRHSDVE